MPRGRGRSSPGFGAGRRGPDGKSRGQGGGRGQRRRLRLGRWQRSAVDREQNHRTRSGGRAKPPTDPLTEEIARLREAEQEVQTALDQLGQPSHFAPTAPSYRIDPERCVGCGACAEVCPVNAIFEVGAGAEMRFQIDPELCTGCESCLSVCYQDGAISRCGSGKDVRPDAG